MDGLKSELNEFNQKIEDYESSELQVVRGDVRGMIESLRKTIQDYLVSGTNAVSYEPGSIAGNTNVIDLYQRVLAGNEYIEQHKDEIELAAQRQQEAFAQIQQDYYEAQCQAREDAGRAKLIQGGAAILIGTIAIVGSAGAAGPAVVAWGACIFGTGTAFYGVSTAAEGAQDVYYGSIGDLETASFNPIRDTVFMGNQTLYDLWGNLNMTAAGICMPLGKALNGAAGMGNKALAWTTAKTIAVEGFKDMSADAKLNEHIAISKVDTDAVLDLRMKELETQRRFLNGDTGNTANKSGSANQYCLSGEEHFEAFKEMYGAENVEWTSRDTLSSADRLRIKDWKYPPSDDLYIKYKDVYQNDLYYNQATGEINWPVNDGFKEGTIVEDTRLPEGTLFKRYGSDNGEFLGTADDSFEARSLAPHSENAEIHYYRMTEEGSMTSGEIAPWFGSEGGGTQFVKYKPDGTKYTIRELEDAGLIEDITDLVEEGVIRIE